MTPPLPTSGRTIGEISWYGCVTVIWMTSLGFPAPGVPGCEMSSKRNSRSGISSPGVELRITRLIESSRESAVVGLAGSLVCCPDDRALARGLDQASDAQFD